MSGRGSQGPSDAQRPGPFVREGAFFLPPQALFFTRTFSRPVFFFFFFFCLRGLRIPWRARRDVRARIGCRIQSAAPRIPRNSLRNPGHLRTPPPPAFLVNFRGKCCAFFLRRCVSGNPPNCFGIFYSSTCLRFVVRRVFRDEFWRRSGVGGVSVFVWKILYFRLKNPAAKSSLFVSLAFLRVLLFLGSPISRVLWGELRRYIGMFFGARLFCRGRVIWFGFGLRTPRGFSPHPLS